MEVIGNLLLFLIVLVTIGLVISIATEIIKLVFRCFCYIIGYPTKSKPKAVYRIKAYRHPTWPGCSDDQN